jgi:hypothetical protein
MPQTYQVTCSECGEVRWPYLPERPDTYVCVRCKSGVGSVGSAKREAGRKAAKARKSRRRQLQAATEASWRTSEAARIIKTRGHNCRPLPMRYCSTIGG